MAEPLRISFVGPDAAAFAGAADALAADGHKVQCFTSPLKALTADTLAPPGLAVIDASRLDDQMLEVFEAHKDAAPHCLLLAAVAPAVRGRAARILNLGSDAILGLPVDPDEVRALLRKLRAPAAAPGSSASIEEKFKWLGEFAGGLAHNVNNPLTTVVGYLQILRSQVNPSDQMSGVLSIMLKECDRIADIIRDLLLFAGNANVTPKPVDVNRAVDAALLLASALEQNDHVRIERTYQPGLPAVMADEEALKLACENIAVNARQAMHDGGTLSVETRTNSSRRILIRFSDTGPGVPKDRQARIFEPFYSGGGDGHVGLGLAAAYGIVKSFGGSIRLESEPGKGASFFIELPAAG